MIGRTIGRWVRFRRRRGETATSVTICGELVCNSGDRSRYKRYRDRVPI